MFLSKKLSFYIESLSLEVSSVPLRIFRWIWGLYIAGLGAYLIYWDLFPLLFGNPVFRAGYRFFPVFLPISHWGYFLIAFLLLVSGLLIAVGIGVKWMFWLNLFTWGYYVLIDRTYYQDHFFLVFIIQSLWIVSGVSNWIGRELPDKIPKWTVELFKWQFLLVATFVGLSQCNLDWLTGNILLIRFSESFSGHTLFDVIKSWPTICIILSLISVFLGVFSSILYLCLKDLFGLIYFFYLLILFLGIDWLKFPDWHFSFYGLLLVLLVLFLPLEGLFGRIKRFFLSQIDGGKPSHSKVLISGLVVFFLIQILLPLRGYLINYSHLLIAGQGHVLSWRMKLDQRSYSIRYLVRDPKTRQEWGVPYPQYSHSSFHIGFAYPIWYTAHRVGRVFSERIGTSVEVYAEAMVSINNGPWLVFVDKSRNLLLEDYAVWKDNDWLLPFDFK